MNKLIIPNHFPVKREGLVAWYSYRNSGSIATTGTWKDYSGNANDGTLVNNTVINKQGANFNGSSDHINCGNGASLALSGARTFSARVYGTFGAAALHAIIAKYGGTANTQDYYFVIYSQKLRVLIADGYGGFKTYNSVPSISDNTWTHITATWDGNISNPVLMYINGEAVSTSMVSDTLTTPLASSEPLVIGARNSSIPYSYLNGIADDVIIFNRDLPPGEIKANYLKNKRN